MGISLEQQVCSLELAKKLKALNVKQESAFYWAHLPEEPDRPKSKKVWMLNDSNVGDEEIYAAFSVAELGEMLPLWTKYWQELDRWCCFVEFDKERTINKDFARTETADTEADARCKMLIHLIETGVVKLGIRTCETTRNT